MVSITRLIFPFSTRCPDCPHLHISDTEMNRLNGTIATLSEHLHAVLVNVKHSNIKTTVINTSLPLACCQLSHHDAGATSWASSSPRKGASHAVELYRRQCGKHQDVNDCMHPSNPIQLQRGPQAYLSPPTINVHLQ